MSIYQPQEVYLNRTFDIDDNISSLPYFRAKKKDRSDHSHNRKPYISCTFPSALSQRIMQVANKSNMAIYLLLLTGVNCLLHRYTGENNVIIGVPPSKEKADHSHLNNVILLKNNVDDTSTFISLFNQVKLSLSEAMKYQNIPFHKMVSYLNVELDANHLPIINTMVSLNEIHSTDYSQDVHSEVIFQFYIEDNLIHLKLIYDENLYDSVYMSQGVEHLTNILSVILYQTEVEFQQLEVLSEPEINQLLVEFNNSVAEYPWTSINTLFEEQVERTPEHVAVVFEDKHLTYRELNGRANQLARTLVAMGVERDQLVAIITERSIEMVIGMLAILKAGGAYVPIDPDYPTERIQYMLDDSGTAILLIQHHLQESVTFTGSTIILDDEKTYQAGDSNLGVMTEPYDLAYVIYTSGTTGKPKGTLIEHKNVVRLLFNSKSLFDFNASDIWTMFHSFCFDFSVWEMYGALLYGGKLVVVPQMTARNPKQFLELLKAQKVTILNQTPTYFYQLIQEEMKESSKNSEIRSIIFGGEALSPLLLKEWKEKYPSTQLINMYGITETTVHVTYKQISEVEIADGKSNIGKPIPTLKAYILDKFLRLQPVGVQGELYISGDGLARGYLNRPGLTAERFVDNPFEQGKKMYKSGDLARLLPDGNLEYVGRCDHQVKIRGYRIELDEVKTAVLKIESVQEAVVVAREGEDELKQLCAYYVGVHPISIEHMRERLRQELPSYMVPSHFVQLSRMPLTSNGKVDLKSLPSPEKNYQPGTAYAAPRNTVEEIIVAVWQTVLGVTRVGVFDNFFDLGGDSIKSIQVSSRLFQAGYRVEMKHLFKHSTIAELSPYVERINRVAEQGDVTGQLMLTPIQRWFLENTDKDAHHFNQALMLYRREGFDEPALRKVLKKLTAHHDVFRTVYRKTEHSVEAWAYPNEERELYSLEVIDVHSVADPAKVISNKSSQIQGSIDVSEGPLMKLGLFTCADGDHLLIAIHHMVVDGVSWRILLEDISSGYDQALAGKEIQLPQKTDSFKLWAEQLSQYANSEELKQELAYWKQIEEVETGPLPKDYDQDYGLVKDSETITIEWTAQETEQLVKQTHRAYHTEINDLLLTALGMAVHKWTGMEQIVVNLEGHGREQLLPERDITRTVGWFTSQYPVVLQIEADQDISKHIKRTKEGLRQIPNKGTGYGILRYLSELPKEEVFKGQPEISFNYLGQFDQDLQNNDIQMSPYSVGDSISQAHRRLYALDLNGMISNGKLLLSISYNGKQYKRETMEVLSELMKASMQEIIAHCVTKEQPELTPSDLSVKGMTIAELDNLLEQTQHLGAIENIYPLSPMQKGMLFHSLLEPNSSAYFELVTFHVRGNLDVAAFEKSVEALVQRHAAFRTNFNNLWNHSPLQIVYRDKKIEFTYKNLRDATEQQVEEFYEGYLKENSFRGFDLSRDSLMRMLILRTDDQTYRFIWSFHHIVMDGWCMPLVIRELFDHYYAIQQQKPLEQDIPTPYSHYIEWLVERDQAEASRYWSEYLKGYEEQTVLPLEKSLYSDEGYVSKKVICQFGEKLTQQIKQVAGSNQVTANTLIQTVWGILLQKYNNSHDVLFGSVVSGRPEGIPGIESMIGLFINTILVRVQSEEHTTFAELLQKTQDLALASHQYETYPLYEIQKQTEQKQDLLSHIMVFENYPAGEQLESIGDSDENLLRIEHVEVAEHINYDFNLIVLPGEQMEVHFGYNANAYDRESVERISGHLVRILKQVVQNPQVAIKEIEVVTEEEKSVILKRFNNTRAEYPSEKTIHQLFEEQVERLPEQIALVCEGKQLTYKELNQKANQLARKLINEELQSEQIVGVMTERSFETIIGLLAVLKAGGVYLPIDPEYPEERIRYMLEDSGAKLLLQQNHLQKPASFSGQILDLNDSGSYVAEGTDCGKVVDPNHLAYVIYTSGTTGKPKGVMLEHRGICNLKRYFLETLQLSQNDRIVQFASISFDASIWEIVSSLFLGATLYIPTQAEILDYRLFEQFISKHGITTATLPPSYVIYLDPNQVPSLQRLVTAGSASSDELVNKWKDSVVYFNAYGPTEDSICSTTWEYTTSATNEKIIPIGRPIHNHRAYIMDKSYTLLPVGVAGELCIAGVGLARGYLNRPDLTVQKFVKNPLVPEERMYKTGDLARWLPDGSIEYVGRIDNQVKIRGYRIELGEVEAALVRMESIQEAVVVPIEGGDGSKQLCAYLVAVQSVPAAQLKEVLAQELPPYMIPSFFVFIEKMPLTPNGKVDHKALPDPKSHVDRGTEYAFPRNEIEEVLISIWQVILGVADVGILDNFFDLGGDSIKSIQVSSRLLQTGYQMKMKHLFKYPTIAQLSPYIEPITRTSEQGEVTGKVPLTPIQRWLFEQKMTEPHHFNQSFMFYQPQGFDETLLLGVMQKIVEHHDALRMVFCLGKDGYEAVNLGVKDSKSVSMEVIPLRDEKNLAIEIERKASQIQSSMDLQVGPLIKLGLFQCADGDHLLVAIHHLVVDMVSWRILFEDIRTGYEQAINGLDIQFAPKTDSFQLWAEKMKQYVEAGGMEQEYEYWREIEQGKTKALPNDYAEDDLLMEDNENITLLFTKDETDQLLKQINRTYQTEINDLLLTALGMAIHSWTGVENVLVNLEGHGREQVIPDIDISRTVGWFTSQYPVVIPIKAGEDVSTWIGATREALRNVPNKGIGYGMIRYLTASSQHMWNIKPEIGFNYLGQFDEDLHNNSLQLSPYSGGVAVSPSHPKPHVLDINGLISNGQLLLDISYCQKQYRRETIEGLAEQLRTSLHAIIEHCLSREQVTVYASELRGPVDAREVTEFADQIFNDEYLADVPGCTFVVVRGNQVLLNKSYGYADVEHKRKMDAEKTPMRVGSITKLFTSTAIMQLIEQGKINLHEDIRAYTDDIDIPRKHQVPLTVGHLMSYTSGLDFTAGISQRRYDPTASLKEMIQQSGLVAVHTPGEHYKYDNFSYALLGHIIEKQTGVAFHQYAKEKILLPLGMNNSSFHTALNSSLILATGYDMSNASVPFHELHHVDYAAGNMISTGSDIAAFMMAILQKGILGNTRILHPDSINQMSTGNPVSNSAFPRSGFGFEMNMHPDYVNKGIRSKSGDLHGFQALLWLLPEDNVGAFFVCNKSNGNRMEIFEAFMKRFYSSY
ncbi:non-ribosomal peptide synthetase [Paenibacillus brasilensis]|uniref:non-ribosomal peptide synthetase n=1 Tax=Paenibacillus brasilensis TaxID=128574 RepID=UPI0012669035|nr:non-ribosomal peptide synthetase [Paenibacillus brasilensis]